MGSLSSSEEDDTEEGQRGEHVAGSHFTIEYPSGKKALPRPSESERNLHQHLRGYFIMHGLRERSLSYLLLKIMHSRLNGM